MTIKDSIMTLRFTPPTMATHVNPYTRALAVLIRNHHDDYVFKGISDKIKDEPMHYVSPQLSNMLSMERTEVEARQQHAARLSEDAHQRYQSSSPLIAALRLVRDDI